MSSVPLSAAVSDIRPSTTDPRCLLVDLTNIYADLSVNSHNRRRRRSFDLGVSVAVASFGLRLAPGSHRPRAPLNIAIRGAKRDGANSP
jgi:hypothetical protein